VIKEEIIKGLLQIALGGVFFVLLVFFSGLLILICRLLIMFLSFIGIRVE